MRKTDSQRATIDFFVILSLVALLCTGCSYLRNRINDVNDVLTVSVGIGLGIGVHAGPINTGLNYISDFFGVRSGCVGYKYTAEEIHYSNVMLICGMDKGWGNLKADARAKSYLAECYFISFPEYDEGIKGHPPIPPYFTQFEVYAGLLGSLRLGINPGEILDLIVGFFGLDLFADDIEGEEDRRHRL